MGSHWICTHLKSPFWKFTMLWKAAIPLLFLVGLSSANLFDGNWTFPFRFPSFDDFFGLNTLLPILNWESPVSGIQIHILNNTNQSVTFTCRGQASEAGWMGESVASEILMPGV